MQNKEADAEQSLLDLHTICVVVKTKKQKKREAIVSRSVVRCNIYIVNMGYKFKFVIRLIYFKFKSRKNEIFEIFEIFFSIIYSS